MSAQPGSAVLLAYGPQGAAQAGGSVLLSYTPPVSASRRVVATVGVRWAEGRPLQVDKRAPMLVAQELGQEVRAVWAVGQPLQAQSRQPWQVAAPMQTGAGMPWGAFSKRLHIEQAQRWGVAQEQDAALRSPWGAFATLLQIERQAAWVGGHPQDRLAQAPWGVFLGRLVREAGSRWPDSVHQDLLRHFPWSRFARYPSPDFSVVTPPGGGADDSGALFAILPSRIYMAVHTLTAHRLPDMALVPIFNVSMSADAGSFAWTFSASGPASLFDQLAPSAGLPTQIRITLDGIPFVFAVDSVQSQEAFGQRGVRISGRSATALLARPYARETARLNTSAATAQQLALDALEFTGAGLDWGLTDWLVPAGAWSHSGTPLAAVQAIVEAAGGYLQSHRTAATLLARHPYPELAGGLPGGPWNWSAPGVLPDVELAPDAIITSGIERRDGPDINGVYVSGTTQGVLALVRRTSTAADKLASLITDPLITTQEAALQRGLAVLGAGGPKHLVQIELPILTGAGQPGVLDVGQLVQVNATSAWRGRVRSVSVNATMPKARQTISLERHLEIA